jgi:SAM-dependent methyltransferase
VGCGHGLDALLAILDGHIESVVGVDPYEKGGNNYDDYVELLKLIEECSLKDRFIVERTDCESHINGIEDDFDLIVAADVMHHIFATRSLLHLSSLYTKAASLFKSFARSTKPHGMIAISEVHRDGLRPFLKKLGILKTHLSYGDKQNWHEWHRPAVEAGWKLVSVKNYVPYAFRAQRWLWNGSLGHKTLCDRYFLYHEK